MSIKRLALLVLLIGGAVAALFWLFGPSDDYRNLPPTADGPWVAFGDSLTEGYGASPGNDYPALLSKHLGMEIRNLGKSGETSEGGLQRVEEVAALKPRVVLLCFGGNDALQGKRVTQTIANVAQIIDRLHAEGSFVVLIGIRSASLRDRNSSHFKKLAREKEVLYVPDMLQGLAFKPIYMSDAIHPNDMGYARIAERLQKALKPVMSKLGASSEK
jgi:lysophospholipase L1-like esterase